MNLLFGLTTHVDFYIFSNSLNYHLLIINHIKKKIHISFDQITVKPDWKIIRDHLSKEGRLTKPNFLKIVSDGTKIFSN